jgi:hypothetical protein
MMKDTYGIGLIFVKSECGVSLVVVDATSNSSGFKSNGLSGGLFTMTQ